MDRLGGSQEGQQRPLSGYAPAMSTMATQTQSSPAPTALDPRTPPIELYIVYRELESILRGKQIEASRRLVGNYITSLDMAGCLITLLQADDELLSLWDDPVLTPALRWGI